LGTEPDASRLVISSKHFSSDKRGIGGSLGERGLAGENISDVGLEQSEATMLERPLFVELRALELQDRWSDSVVAGDERLVDGVGDQWANSRL